MESEVVSYTPNKRAECGCVMILDEFHGDAILVVEPCAEHDGKINGAPWIYCCSRTEMMRIPTLKGY